MGDGSALWLGLMGSGEFEPWAEAVDRWLLDRATGDGRVLLLPTASAPEGDDVFDNWAEMGLAHYRRQSVAAEVLPLKTREEADRPEFARPLDSASMVFFSGGNPAYLARTLVGSRFWDALLAAMGRGLAYAGCSAGVACLGEESPDSTASMEAMAFIAGPGLRLFPKTLFGPHWDMLDSFMPGLKQMFVAWVPPDCKLVAIDERTAVLGDGREWTVVGVGQAHLMENGNWVDYRAGDSFIAPLSAR